MTRDEREAMGLQRGTYFGVAPEICTPAEWRDGAAFGLVPSAAAWHCPLHFVEYVAPDALLRVLDVLAKPREERA